ncbi:MAG: cytochrome P460 family protein [Campylobacterota bacterium]
MKRCVYICIVIAMIIVSSGYYFFKTKEERVMVFPKWKKSYDLTKGVMESDAHNAYIEILLNERAVDAYVEIKPVFPVGSEVFKPLYRDAEGKEFARLVIMVKMEEGYDSENGDWWYGVYDESGTQMAYEGRIPECISCHAMAKETDYLFARSVMKKLNGIDTHELFEYDDSDDGEDY